MGMIPDSSEEMLLCVDSDFDYLFAGRTEHEGMFSEQGIPIKALIARKGPDSSVTWVEPKELARRLEPEEEAAPAGEVQE